MTELTTGARTEYRDFNEFVEHYRPKIYKQITDYVRIKEPKQHYMIARDYIDRMGKYRRPGLLVITGLLYGAKPEELILPAAAQQLSEDWILMQDDAEDDSEMRRGKPAAQKIYGWVHTVNASNVGQMAMWKMLKDYILEYGEKRGNRLYDKFYEMIDTTAGGQWVENEFIHHTKNLGMATEKTYFDIIHSKTCFYTIYGPMQLGAIIAEQPDSVLKFLEQVGTDAGKAFQIVDDIIDMTVDEKITGKRRYGDLYEGKLTLMVLHAYGHSTPAERKRFDEIYRKKREEKTAEEIDFIVKAVEKHKSLDYARSVAMSYGKMAEQEIQNNIDKLPKNAYTPIFLSAVREMFVRIK